MTGRPPTHQGPAQPGAAPGAEVAAEVGRPPRLWYAAFRTVAPHGDPPWDRSLSSC